MNGRFRRNGWEKCENPINFFQRTFPPNLQKNKETTIFKLLLFNGTENDVGLIGIADRIGNNTPNFIETNVFRSKL